MHQILTSISKYQEDAFYQFLFPMKYYKIKYELVLFDDVSLSRNARGEVVTYKVYYSKAIRHLGGISLYRKHAKC